jgi:tRNA (adenine37-N6)-methyltransferase
MNGITMEPVGFVQNDVQDQVDENWGKVRSKIELEPEFHGGLLGLAEFSHVIILTWLNEAHYSTEQHLQRHPRGLEELPLVGIFAQRSKDRPNRIGLTAARLFAVGENWLEVEGLDAINGTPVLDIKPYFPAYDRRENAFTPAWVDFILKEYF